MTIVEFQLTKRKLFFAYAWRYFQRSHFRAALLIPLAMAIALVFIFEDPIWGRIALSFILFLTPLHLMQLYQTLTVNPQFTSKTKIVFGEAGIISIKEGVRNELTWESLWAWSQSENFIFLEVNRMGSAMAIPKSAFTDAQMDEVFRLMTKIPNRKINEPPLETDEEPEIPELKEQFVGKVFLSYAREDINTAMHLFNDLHEAGVDVWFDRKSLLPGQNWKSAIRQAIRESRFFLALISSNSVSKKGYIQKELKHALEILEEYPETAIFIIPIRLDDCKLTDERLQELHWIDIFIDWEEGLSRVFDTLKSQSAIQKSLEHKTLQL